MKLQKVSSSDYEIFEPKQTRCVLPGNHLILKSALEYFVFWCHALRQANAGCERWGVAKLRDLQAKLKEQ